MNGASQEVAGLVEDYLRAVVRWRDRCFAERAYLPTGVEADALNDAEEALRNAGVEPRGKSYADLIALLNPEDE